MQLLFLVTNQTSKYLTQTVAIKPTVIEKGEKKITIYCMEWWTCHGPHGMVLSKKLSIHMILDAGIRFCLMIILIIPKGFFIFIFLTIKILFSPLIFFIRFFLIIKLNKYFLWQTYHTYHSFFLIIFSTATPKLIEYKFGRHFLTKQWGSSFWNPWKLLILWLFV